MVPDLIVCNGESAHNLLRKFHMPQTHLLLAEALRYSSLTGRKDELKQYQGKKEIVLLIGDVNLFPTVRMLELLSDAVSQLELDSDHSIFVKPHPDCPSLANFINQLGLSGVCSITTKPLDQLWSNIKVAVCSNSTTASIEAAWLGVPVAVMRDMSQVNLCPLGNISELIYFQSADQLVERINSPIQIEIPANYFSLDENYPRWHKILEELN